MLKGIVRLLCCRNFYVRTSFAANHWKAVDPVASLQLKLNHFQPSVVSETSHSQNKINESKTSLVGWQMSKCWWWPRLTGFQPLSFHAMWSWFTTGNIFNLSSWPSFPLSFRFPRDINAIPCQYVLLINLLRRAGGITFSSGLRQPSIKEH